MDSLQIANILLTIVHVVVCLFLIAVVLFQQGKGADIAGAFGGGGSQTAFGARQATTLLSKITTWAAAIFMLSSLTLAITKSLQPKLSQDYPEEGAQVQEAPAPEPVPVPESTPEEVPLP